MWSLWHHNGEQCTKQTHTAVFHECKTQLIIAVVMSCNFSFAYWKENFVEGVCENFD